MKFKKIYIEITNVCNLNCSFCALTNREKRFMNIKEFSIVLDKIKNYTKYIYLHIMGEALLHPNLKEMIKIAKEKGIYVQITTNGYLIKNLEDIDNIRQINVSLQAFNKKYHKTLEEYLSDIYEICEKLSKKGTYINYRMWVDSETSPYILKSLEERYKININKKQVKLKEFIFYSKENEFIWPIKLKNKNYNGYCPALTDQLGVLVDGSVVPCCLDNNGSIILGNIFKNNLEEIINSDKYKNMLNNFKNNKRIYDLCKNCSFYQNKL